MIREPGIDYVADQRSPAPKYDDFIASYPNPINDDVKKIKVDIQQVVNSKKEFELLRTDATLEKLPPGPGNAYKHQLVVERAMTRWLNNILLTHQPGTGKTCTFSRVSEMMKYMSELYEPETTIDGAIVLVKGPTLKEEFKQQILCQCTPGTYLTPAIENVLIDEKNPEKSISRRKNAITTSLKRWYTVMTYGEFARKFAIAVMKEIPAQNGKKARKVFDHAESILTDEEIIKQYSNKVFFLDEAHNLRTSKGDFDKRQPDDAELEKEYFEQGVEDESEVEVSEEDIPEEEDDSAGELKGTKESEYSRYVYSQIHRVFHLVEKSKIVVATATPMINRVDEIGPIMNLLLPYDKQLPENFDYLGKSIEELYPYFNGYISYVRAFETGAIPTYMGDYLRDGNVLKSEFDPELIFTKEEGPFYDPSNGNKKESRISSDDESNNEDARSEKSDEESEDDIKSSDSDDTDESDESDSSSSSTKSEVKKSRRKKDESGKKGILQKNTDKSENYIKPPRDAAEKMKYTVMEEGEDGSKIAKEVDSESKVYYTAMRYANVGPNKSKKVGQLITYLEIDKSQKETKFYVSRRQASIFVFPDGSYGNAGFKKYVDTRSDKYLLKKNFRDILTDKQKKGSIKKLSLWSCEYASIIDQIMRSKGEKFYIYTEFVALGAVLLGLILELFGFSKYTENSSIFYTERADYLAPICSNREDVTKLVKKNFAKKPRYAILTSNMSGQETSSMMEAFNSAQNMTGEYIQVLIGTPVSRDGINLADILQIHIASAGWNPSTTYQAISRGLRATSHERILEYRGVDNVDVKIYKHAPIARNIFSGPDRSRKSGQPSKTGLSETSVAVDMYSLSEEKEVLIRQMMRKIKQMSIDCFIHRNRNIRPTDRDYSVECDYQKCNYKCIAGPSKDIVPNKRSLEETDDFDNTYDLYYSGPIIDDCALKISSILKDIFVIKMSELYKIDEFVNTKKKFLDLAVSKLITRKTVILDRYGFRSYVYEDKGFLYLSRDYPLYGGSVHTENNYSSLWYTEYLTANRTISLNDYLLEQTRESDKVKINKLRERLNKKNAAKLILGLDDIGRIDLLEDAVQAVESGNGNEIDEIIVEYFVANNSLFYFSEPVKAIKESKEIMDKKMKGSGRRSTTEAREIAKKNTIIQREVDDLRPSKGSQDVILHILYIKQHKSTEHGFLDRYLKMDGRIRIYKPKTSKKWEDTNIYEYPIYNKKLKEEINGLMSELNKKDLYGIIIDGEFYSVDRLEFGKRRKTKGDTVLSKTEAKSYTDTRENIKGRKCGEKNRSDKNRLLDMLYRVGWREKLSESKNKDNLIRHIETHVSGAKVSKDDPLEKLQLFAGNALAESKYLCEQLRKEMVRKNLIYYG